MFVYFNFCQNDPESAQGSLCCEGGSSGFRTRESQGAYVLLPKLPKVGKLMARYLKKGNYSTYFWGPGIALISFYKVWE